MQGRPGADASPLSWVAATILALGTVAVAFSSLLSASRIPFYRDLLFFFVPFKAMVAERLAAGTVPLWNPHVSLGSPLLANLHSGALYPPSALLLLPLPVGFNLFLFFHYVVAAIGSVLLFRGRGLDPVAALVGALTFVIGGFSVSMLNVTNFLQAFAWVPWVMLAWSRYDERPTARGFAAVAFTVAMQTLAAGVELELLTLLVLFVASTVAAGRSLRVRAERAAALGGAALLALGLAAAQVLPTAELLGTTSRGTALDFAEVSLRSMSPVSLLQLVFPHSSSLVSPADRGGLGPRLEVHEPWVASLYLGLAPLAAIAAGCVAGRERRLWTLVALAGVVLALGKSSPVFGMLYELAPSLLGKFRYPEKLWFLAHLAGAVLAAEGTAAILRRDDRARRAAVALAATITVIGLAICVFRWTNPLRFVQSMPILAGDPTRPADWAIGVAADLYFKAIRAAAFGGLLVGIFALRGGRRIGEGTFVSVFVLVAAVDLAATHHDLNLSTSWHDLAASPKVVDVEELRAARERVLHVDQDRPKNVPAGFHLEGLEYPLGPQIERLLRMEWQRLFPNSAMFSGIGTAGGAEAFRPRSTQTLMSLLATLPPERSVRLLGLLSTRYLLGRGPMDAPGLTAVEPLVPGLGTVYRVSEVAPRAYLAGRLTVAADDVEALNRLIDPAFSIGRDAVVDAAPGDWTDAAPSEPLGSVAISAYENEQVRLEVDAGRRVLVVLNDAFFPGWEALVDGAPAPVVRANSFVRGVFVDAGSHRVELRYRPASFRRGVAVSAVSALAWLLLVFVPLRRGRAA